MVKMNFTDNQTAFEYAMYMMLGSYFDKAICKNKLLEKKMFVQYQEQKERQQYQLEDICIGFVEKDLKPQLPEGIWKQQVEVKFCPTNLKGLRDIQFHGPDYILRVSGIYKGKKNTNIHFEVWHKNAKPQINLAK